MDEIIEEFRARLGNIERKVDQLFVAFIELQNQLNDENLDDGEDEVEEKELDMDDTTKGENKDEGRPKIKRAED